MYVQQIAKGNFEDGYFISRSPNPFASTCGRVCAAPCEDNCRRGKIDQSVSIRSLKKFLTEKFGPESRHPETEKKLFGGRKKPKSHIVTGEIADLLKNQPPNSDKKVAVIGSGPAGLGCAHDLALLGYKVTIFEEKEKAGGMMRLGIPSYRLPEAVLEKEIETIRSMGVDIILNKRISLEYGLAELKKEGYQAFFIGVGAGKGNMVNIDGASLSGVHVALDFLMKSKRGIQTEIGKKVVVIGGGLVAMDAARYARRKILDENEDAQLLVAIDAARDARRQILSQEIKGDHEVHVVSLESFEQMPTSQSVSGRQELAETLEEDIKFHPSWGPERVLGENGRVIGIELKKVLQVFNADGRFDPKFDEKEKKVIPCDSVIFAIGQASDISFIRKEDNIENTRRSTIKADDRLATTSPEVFAGGDVVFGPRNLIDAVANGKKAARSIDEFLSGRTFHIEYDVNIEIQHTPRYKMFADYEKTGRRTPPVSPPTLRTGKQEIELSFDEQTAREQATRCLTCHTSPIYDGDICILCGRCEDICPQKCLTFVLPDQVDVKDGKVGDILARQKVQADQEFTALLKDDTRCIRCGLCVIRCPTGAMTMETILIEEKAVYSERN
jgi:NADPH-dependent glutamate synthase beta subunit-like oxidoreductase